MAKRHLSVYVVFMMLLALSSSAQPTSLRARARAEGGTVTRTLTVDFSEYSFRQLVDKADTIAVGRVTSIRTHLTNDEVVVVTDVTIQPNRLLKQGVPVGSRAQPGPTVPLIVRHVGGTVLEDGLKMSTIVNSFPVNEEFSVGEEVICFLAYDASQGVFELVDGPFAAFRVKQGEVHRLTKEAGVRLPHEVLPVERFLTGIADQINRR